MKTYNKLIRDKIPDIIKGKGETCITHVATEEEYAKALVAKLIEEVKEYAEAEGEKTGVDVIDELADIMEVMVAIIDSKKIDCGELERVRLEKREKRGGFEKRLILEQS